MNFILHDGRRAIRNLVRIPQFTLPALLVLALGLGVSTAVLGTLRTVLFQPLPFQAPERIVSLWWHERGQPDTSTMPASWPLFGDLGRQLQSTEAVAGLVTESQILTGCGEPQQVRVAAVTPEYFRVFAIAPLLGSLAWPEQGAPGAVVTERFWRSRLGGQPGVLGRSLTLNGASYPVLAVLPGRVGTQGNEVFLPYRPTDPVQAAARYHCYMPVFARLRSGVSLAEFQRELASLGQALAQQHGGPERTRELLGDGYQAQLRGNYRDLVRLLGLAAGLLFLITVMNLTGQFLLRSLNQINEIALRTALGATPLRASRGQLAEAVVLALAGAGLGLGVAWIGLQLLRPLVGSTLRASRPLELDAQLFGFAVLLALVLSLVLAVLPALLVSRRGLAQVLKDGGRTQAGTGSRATRKALVALQVALAFALVAGFGLFSRSLIHLQRVQLGLEVRDVTVFTLDPAVHGRTEQAGLATRLADLVNRFQGLPGVRAAGTISHLPVERFGMNYTPNLHGRTLAPGDWVELRSASPDLFAALGVTVLQGRTFTDAECRTDQRVAVVSRSTAERCWPGQSALGQQLTQGGDDDWATVVGVVEDVRNGGPKINRFQRTAYFPGYRGFAGETVFVIRTGPGQSLPLATMRTLIQQAAPGTPIQDLRTMAEVVAQDLESERTLTALLGFAGAVALGLALVGLYGALSYSVLGRTREFGVRLALGARSRQVFGLVLREGLAMVSVGLVLGLGLTIAAARVMANLVYGVATLDGLSLAGTALILAAVAILAGLVPALRAARIQPARALGAP